MAVTSSLSTSSLSTLAYRADQFFVETGANLGDAFGIYEDLVLDDTYQLLAGSVMERLALDACPDGTISIAKDTDMGRAGARLHLDCVVTLMPAVGPNVEVVSAVEVDGDGMISGIYLLPLAPLRADQGYTLVAANRQAQHQKLAQLASASFSRGTHITLATGAQCKIEDLKVGDRVLTRDEGPREIRWIGQSTAPAVGNLAPILIKKGALNNAQDLIVSPQHRLMVYQRSDSIGLGTPEILVRASDLVNGSTVTVQDGGYVDYFQILFDRHHIIYAEGIAAETLLLTPFTAPALCSAAVLEHTAADQLPYLEPRKSQLPRGDAIAALKQASRG